MRRSLEGSIGRSTSLPILGYYNTVVDKRLSQTGVLMILLVHNGDDDNNDNNNNNNGNNTEGKHDSDNLKRFSIRAGLRHGGHRS